MSNDIEREYSQGICADGAAILKDGQPMTIEEILEELREGQAARAQPEQPSAGVVPEEWREAVQRAVDELSIMDESEGIAGFHLNGDVSLWDEGELPAVREELQALLTAAPTAPDVGVISKDAYDGAREDLQIWKKRALEAEKLLQETHPHNGEQGEECGIKFLIWSNEHNCYWRPNSAGYTRSIAEAGRYGQSQAESICRNASPRAGSDLDETIPPEMMMVAPEYIAGLTRPQSPKSKEGE